eukprot:2798429-Amphidinium_carterae.1
MYGTQDASNIWQRTWACHLEKHGYVMGTSNPALFCSEHLKGFCHGDDFVVAACEDEADIFEGILADKFEMRCTGKIGFKNHLDKELEILHRKVRISLDGAMEIEADTKHVPILLKELGLERGNSVTTPRVKLSQAEAKNVEESPMLSPTLATLFRSGTMRAAYLGQDR